MTRGSVGTVGFAEMTVLDAVGESVVLGTLWRDQTAVLVFLRHFG